jgi:hypothetical protein
VILAFVVGVLLVKVVKGIGLGQTAAFYIGLAAAIFVAPVSAPAVGAAVRRGVL